MIPNNENVARAIFSPKMVVDGEIMPEAFRLRESIHEDYLSVIFITIDGQNLIGGKALDMPESEQEQDFFLQAIQRELVEIAQKGLFIA